MGKQITLYDRIQASLRLADKGLVKKMTIKGSYINSLPKLYGMSTLKKSDNGHTFVRVGTIGNVEKFYKRISSPATVIPPWKHIETYSLSDKEKMNPATLIRDGKYLAVCVDLTHKKSKILADFESLLDTLIPYIGNKTLYFGDGRGKEKTFQFSIWHVYDLYTNTKKPNFTAVARRLSGKSGQARDNAQLSACLKAVKRAYKRACEIIKAVDV